MTAIAAVVMCGGKARRMGGADKGMLTLGGRTLVDQICERMQDQVDALLVNYNGEAPPAYQSLPYDIRPDSCPGHLGPLAGVLTGIEWARETVPSCRAVVSAPVDTPLLPLDLVRRMVDALDTSGAQIAVARSGRRIHPVVGMWPMELEEPLRKTLTEDGAQSVRDWIEGRSVTEVEFPMFPLDPFFNINTPMDLDAAARALSVLG